MDALTTAGCVVIYREHASGANRGRPELLKALQQSSPATC